MKTSNFIAGIVTLALVLLVAIIVFAKMQIFSLLLVSVALLLIVGLLWIVFKKQKPSLSIEMPYIKITWNIFGLKVHNYYGNYAENPVSFETKEKAEKNIEELNSKLKLKTRISLEILEEK